MNIFVLDMDPFKSALYMCNAHVIKMIVESCQLLSTQDRLELNLPEEDDRYKITHVNHPCRLSLDNTFNYIWLEYHLYGLLKEYELRYEKVHACYEMYEKYWRRIDDELLYSNKLNFIENYSELLDLTKFSKCMPEEFWVGEDKNDDILNVVASYRNYYKYKKQTMSRFNYYVREEPSWLNK